MAQDEFTTAIDLNLFGFPRPGSICHNISSEDAKTRKKTLGQFKIINKLLVPLYRLRIAPLVGVGRIILLLHTKGWKSGKKRITPVEYRRIKEIIHIFCSRGEKSHWYRNMLAYPSEIRIQIGFRSYPVQFEVLEKQEAFNEVIRYYVMKHGKAAKELFGWNPEKDDPESTDFQSLAKIIKIIRIYRREE